MGNLFITLLLDRITEAQFLEAILKPLNFLLSEHSGKLNEQKR